MDAVKLVSNVSGFLGDAFATTIFSPSAMLPSAGIAILTYLLVSRQLDMIHDDSAEPEEFGTAGEANEWLGGPTSEWLGV